MASLCLWLHLVAHELTGRIKSIAERIGIFMFAFWGGGGCLLLFVNGMIWRNDALDRAPVFCDISE